MSNYTIEHETDAESEDGFIEWWVVTNGLRSFNADSEDDAKWLCYLLNATQEITGAPDR